jgi:fatty acid desaturase
MSKSLKGLIKPSELVPFQKAKNFLNFSIIFFLFFLTFSLIYIHSLYPYLYITLPFMIISAVAQHTLATFIHEAAHGHVFSNKSFNDRAGHFLFAAPLLSYLEDYRYFHWEHHRFTGKTGKDPELFLYRAMGVKKTYQKKSEIFLLFFQTLIGMTAIKGLIFLNKFYIQKRSSGEIKRPGLFEHLSILFWAIIVPWFFWKNGLIFSYVIVWIFPMFTIFTTLLMWHGLGEHIREKESELHENTFSHHFNFLTTLILYPINSSYHLEHHLYPQLPWHSMKKFRAWAEGREEYKKLADQLVVENYFQGEKSVLNLAFPIKEEES